MFIFPDSSIFLSQQVPVSPVTRQFIQTVIFINIVHSVNLIYWYGIRIYVFFLNWLTPSLVSYFFTEAELSPLRKLNMQFALFSFTTLPDKTLILYPISCFLFINLYSFMQMVALKCCSIKRRASKHAMMSFLYYLQVSNFPLHNFTKNLCVYSLWVSREV